MQTKVLQGMRAMLQRLHQQRRETQMKPNRNKPNDYRNWSPAALDAAIMYEIENCRCTQRLNHLLAARNYKGA
jgi:hypothetical protein